MWMHSLSDRFATRQPLAFNAPAHRSLRALWGTQVTCHVHQDGSVLSPRRRPFDLVERPCVTLSGARDYFNLRRAARHHGLFVQWL